MDYCIDQPGCLGDILFTLKIGEELSKKGTVYWQIAPTFWNSGINRIKTSAIIGPSSPKNVRGAEVIKLCDLTHRSDPELMKIKYTSIGMDWNDWADYVKYDRDPDIENAIRQHFNLSEGEPFIFYNDTYGPGQKHNGVVNSIPKNYSGKIIKLEIFEGVTVFDWAWIFENAEQIHTVDTSILYVIETLNLKCKKMTCHPRHYKFSNSQINNLFKKPWEFIEYDRDNWRKLCPNEEEF